MMATFPISIRRLVFIGGFAVIATAAPAIAVVTVPASSGPAVACAAGEEEDVYSGECVPHTVPNSPDPFGAIAGNPDLPAVEEPGGGGGIPCTGGNAGQCIGLAEEDEAEGPPAQARSSVESSPTVTGSIG